MWKSEILSKDAVFRVRVPTDLFFSCARDYSTKIYGSLSFIISFAHNHSTKKFESTMMYFFHLYTTIWPEIRFLINLIFLFVHDPMTKN